MRFECYVRGGRFAIRRFVSAPRPRILVIIDVHIGVPLIQFAFFILRSAFKKTLIFSIGARVFLRRVVIIVTNRYGVAQLGIATRSR